MTPKTFIFIGRSGCGKGTQAELIQKYIKEKDSSGEILYLETGARFRDFIKEDAYSSALSKEIMKNGDRQPDFLAVWMWAHILVDTYKGHEHMVFDGITRSLPEAMTFTTAMDFYKREKVIVVYLNVSREWSEQRLLARGRADDLRLEEIKKRLDWFDKDSAPAIDYFNIHDRYTLLDINGEQSIEKVHQDIVEKLGW